MEKQPDAGSGGVPPALLLGGAASFAAGCAILQLLFVPSLAFATRALAAPSRAHRYYVFSTLSAPPLRPDDCGDDSPGGGVVVGGPRPNAGGPPSSAPVSALKSLEEAFRAQARPPALRAHTAEGCSESQLLTRATHIGRSGRLRSSRRWRRSQRRQRQQLHRPRAQWRAAAPRRRRRRRRRPRARISGGRAASARSRRCVIGLGSRQFAAGKLQLAQPASRVSNPYKRRCPTLRTAYARGRRSPLFETSRPVNYFAVHNCRQAGSCASCTVRKT